MKGFKTTILILAAIVAGVGVAMAVTNPGPDAYEDFASEKLTEYLRTEGASRCDEVPEISDQVPEVLGSLLGELNDRCEDLVASLLDSNQGQIRQLITDNTQRRNYGVLSIYTTELGLEPVIAGYEFQTVGVFQQFYIYKVEPR